MVVCEGATVLNVVTSLMMNGICCAYQYDEDERRQAEQREYLRKSIKVEWQRHQLEEEERIREELRKQTDAEKLAQERRRLLMETKRQAQRRRTTYYGDEDGDTDDGSRRSYQKWRSDEPISPVQTAGMEAPLPRARSDPVVGSRDRRSVMSRRNVLSASPDQEHRRHHQLENQQLQHRRIKHSPSTTSSLLDQDEDSDDEEMAAMESAFEEIKL